MLQAIASSVESKLTKLKWRIHNCEIALVDHSGHCKEWKNIRIFINLQCLDSTSPFSAWTGKMLQGNQKLHLLWSIKGTFCWWMSGFSLWKASKLSLLTTQLHCNIPILPEWKYGPGNKCFWCQHTNKHTRYSISPFLMRISTFL